MKFTKGDIIVGTDSSDIHYGYTTKKSGDKFIVRRVTSNDRIEISIVGCSTKYAVTAEHFKLEKEPTERPYEIY